ncbi:MAG: hypothetical protein H6708_26405 [Kofleriaceae bacterium]|nr:hypothetical protein [Myxococcales bacterium]MCB9563944.1 hypothetical protein [Kofleriaceae bacterium]
MSTRTPFAAAATVAVTVTVTVLGGAVVTVAPVAAAPSITLGYETGPAYVAQNDGRYGDAGTPYEAGDVGQQANLVVVSRTTVEVDHGPHAFILLYAPFDVTTRVTLADDLRFRDTRFAAGTVVDHRYRFDGFRASYLHRVLPAPFGLELGASLQIRNAAVAFTSVDGAAHDEQDDIGLVGALKARATYRPATGPWAALEADALSTFGLIGDVSGGIYDVAVEVGGTIRPGVDLYLNARLLGGGAEVPSQAIDNWANIVSFGAGVRVDLGRVGPRG